MREPPAVTSTPVNTPQPAFDFGDEDNFGQALYPIDPPKPKEKTPPPASMEADQPSYPVKSEPKIDPYLLHEIF